MRSAARAFQLDPLHTPPVSNSAPSRHRRPPASSPRYTAGASVTLKVKRPRSDPPSGFSGAGAASTTTSWQSLRRPATTSFATSCARRAGARRCGRTRESRLGGSLTHRRDVLVDVAAHRAGTVRRVVALAQDLVLHGSVVAGEGAERLRTPQRIDVYTRRQPTSALVVTEMRMLRSLRRLATLSIWCLTTVGGVGSGSRGIIKMQLAGAPHPLHPTH